MEGSSKDRKRPASDSGESLNDDVGENDSIQTRIISSRAVPQNSNSQLTTTATTTKVLRIVVSGALEGSVEFALSLSSNSNDEDVHREDSHGRENAAQSSEETINDKDARDSCPELGYFLFEDEPVNFESIHIPVENLTSQWHPIDILQQPTKQSVPTTENEGVTLQPLQNERFGISLSGCRSFDGIVQTKPKSGDATSTLTDLQCLLGIVSQFSTVVVIKDCQALFRHDNKQNITVATVMVTLGFPQLMLEPQNRHGSRGRDGAKAKRNIVVSKGKHLKLLHPAIQAILSAIQCNWEALDRTMKMLLGENTKDMSENDCVDDDRKRRKKQRRIFPTQLSLDELYLRMESSQKSRNMAKQWRSKHIVSETHDCAFIRNLPREILVDRIAPFLRAASINSLRNTCKYMHYSLSAVVPGLKLRLYSHQDNSLAWMRERECRLLTEEVCLTDSNTTSSSYQLYDSCDSDLHRGVSGGQSTLLKTRDGAFSCRVSQTLGRELTVNSRLNKLVARGGILADEPGLGKSITVLSLILQTAGLMTDSGSRATDKVTKDNIFSAYWDECIPFEFQKQDLTALSGRLARAFRFQVQIFDKIRLAISRGKFRAFQDFERDIRNQVDALFPPGSGDANVGDDMKRHFEDMVKDYKETQIQHARRSYSKSSSNPDSSVAALWESFERRKIIDSLIESQGSLIVVPWVLLDHWRDQIDQHVDFTYLSNKKPLVFEFTAKTDAKKVHDAATAIKEATHEACVFIDRAPTKPLPPADFLARFRIVVTSNKRFMYEWKNGSFEEELRRTNGDELEEKFTYFRDFRELDRDASSCSLLKVFWLRLVVDEGHSMGRSQQNASVQFASWVPAERRWAMTGTPTKHGTTALNQIHALMSFLQHEFFTSKLEGTDHWRRCVVKSWKEGHVAAFARLRSLLQTLMKRHTKRDIAELQFPFFKWTEVQMSEPEVLTYNTLVTAIQSNLLLTSIKQDAKQDSLLHVNNRRLATEALTNIRIVCAGYMRVVPQLSDKLWKETIDLAQEFKLSEAALSRIRNFMYSAENGTLSNCASCGIGLSVLLVTPCCGDLVCTDCVSTEVFNINLREHVSCILCSQPCSVDDLQRFQPGFRFDWLENQKASRSQIVIRDPSNASPVVAAPAPIIRPQGERRRTNKPGDGHECVYDSYSIDGKCTKCFAEHEGCNLLKTGRCPICHRTSIECSPDESKSTYLIKKFTSLSAEYVNNSKGRPLKVIVFSQHKKPLNLVGSRLLDKFGSGCIAEHWGIYRRQELQKFRENIECFCLLLSNDGSEGLDLSFVTHIFFLEAIWDRARADQAIARAWRMGASGRVEVETIVAEKTVEERMEEYERTIPSDGENTSSSRTSSRDYLATKTQALLSSLSYITDYQSFRKAAFDEDQLGGEDLLKRLKEINAKWKDGLLRTSGAKDDEQSRFSKLPRVTFR